MAIELAVVGNGKFRGSRSNLVSYQVDEESTPIDPNDTSGAVGSINFSVYEDASDTGSILLLNDAVTLTDQSNGTTTGTVTGISTVDGVASVSADSRLGLLVNQVTVSPYNGTLGGAFTYYLGLAGITTGIVIDSTITATPVVLQGLTASLWDIIKFMCSAYQVEVSLVSNNIVLRPLRVHTLNTLKDSTRTWNVQNGQLAQTIEIYYYNNTVITSGLVYPLGGYTSDIPTYQVDAGQTIVQNIPVNVSLTSLQQPTCVSFVAEGYTGPPSVYAVAGNDGLPIPPAEWAAYGGNLTVAIGADGQSIDVTITGMTFNEAAPFTIGVSSGPSNYYSALRISGSGVSFNQKKLTIPTGVESSKAPQVVGVTVDNPQISTILQAYTAGMKTAQSFAAPIRTIQATSTVVNRAGDKGSTNYPTFTNFTTQYPTQTFSAFDTLQSGQKFSDFTLAEFNLVKDNFDNQAFGNVAGSRVLFRQAYYRVRSATTDQGLINYSAEADTIFGDFDTINTGKTFSQFDTKFSGLKFQDFGVIPLWT